jgi:hypothetical protein
MVAAQETVDKKKNQSLSLKKKTYENSFERLDFKFILQRSSVQVLQTSRLLEIYLIVNF